MILSLALKAGKRPLPAQGVSQVMNKPFNWRVLKQQRKAFDKTHKRGRRIQALPALHGALGMGAFALALSGTLVLFEFQATATNRSKDPNSRLILEGKEYCAKTVVLQKKVVGHGSYGRVQLAQQGDESLAVKVVPDSARTRPIVRNELSALERIKRLGGHENIVGFKGSLLHKSRRDEHWLVFEHVKGDELFNSVVENGAFSVGDTKSIVRQLLKALHFLHRDAGIVHLDVKPENILLNDHKQVKLIDFGSSLPLKVVERPEDEGERVFASRGTCAYSAPETLERKPYWTPSSDVFSLGCVTYILLTGKHPFDPAGERSDTSVVKAIKEKPVSFQDAVWKRHKDLQFVVSKMLDKNPQTRISVHELLKHPCFQDKEKPAKEAGAV